MPSNICFPNISKAQSLQRRATSKDWSLQDPSSSDDFSQVLLSQLWTVVLRDLDAALISKYVRDGTGRRFGYRYLQLERDGRAFSGQCFSSECRSGIHKQAPFKYTHHHHEIKYVYNLHGAVFKAGLSNSAKVLNGSFTGGKPVWRFASASTLNCLRKLLTTKDPTAVCSGMLQCGQPKS